MRILNLLLVSALLSVQGYSIGKGNPAANCDKLKVTAEAQNTSEKNDGKVIIKVTQESNSNKKIDYIFCDSAGKVINEGAFDKPSKDNLSKGKYFCIVHTSDCSKKIDFTIE